MSDLIRRQDVLDFALRIGRSNWKESAIRKWVDELPSAETNCVKCKHYYEIEEEHGIESHCRMDSAHTAQQWIPCSERLPDSEEKTYWVCTDTPYQCECRWTNVNPFWTNKTTDWHWTNFDIPQFSKVVAWMPLPEPYTEEQHE